MKIIESQSGEAYQLEPGTQLEIERTNLFFNDYGEQSLPVTLPDTQRNRRLARYPSDIANSHRPATDIECSIINDDFFTVARQAILSASEGEGIETSFYLNEGTLLSKIQDVSLLDVFGEECVEGVNSLSDAIAFCHSLEKGTDERMAIFSCCVDDGEYTVKYGGIFQEIYKLKDVNKLEENGRFQHENASTIQRGEDIVNLPAGVYITPFLKVNYVLKRLFKHFGYTLQPNFFSQTVPFSRMVLLNNTCDTLLTGKIKYADLLPDVTCDQLLEVMRKKFLCEFIPNELEKTIGVILFKDIVNSPSQIDLSPYVVGKLELSYPEERKRITLAGQPIRTSIDVPRMNSLTEVNVKAPASSIGMCGAFEQKQCVYYASHHVESMSNAWYEAAGYVASIVVSSSSMPYDAGGKEETDAVEIEEVLPEYRNLQTGELASYLNYTSLCVGEPRWLNSIVVEAGQNIEDAQKESQGVSDYSTLPVMLAFAPESGTDVSLGQALEQNSYALSYNGSHGIYEKFYRAFDNIHRNSLCLVEADLNLPPGQAGQTNIHGVVTLKGQRLIWNKLSYALSSRHELAHGELYTIRDYEPISQAPSFEQLYPSTVYFWKAYCSTTVISREEYEASNDKDLKQVVVPIDRLPTEALFLSQEKCFKRSWCCKDDSWDQKAKYTRLEFWVTVNKYS